AESVETAPGGKAPDRAPPAPPAASAVTVMVKGVAMATPVAPAAHVTPAAAPASGVNREGDADEQDDDGQHGERPASHHLSLLCHSMGPSQRSPAAHPRPPPIHST